MVSLNNGVIKSFANTLVKASPNEFEFFIGKEKFVAKKGIEQNFKYAKDERNFLGKNIEYKVIWKKITIPISLQLYYNTRDHYRIFGFTSPQNQSKNGLLFSVNLTTGFEPSGDGIELQQTLKIFTRQLSKESREKRRKLLVDYLWLESFRPDKNKIILGYYNIKNKSFLNTSAVQFIKDFIKVAIIKGHFMGNKGYSLPFIVDSIRKTNLSIDKRRIPSKMRYEKLIEGKRKCSLCGRSAKDGVKLEIDHIIPFSKGGKTEPKNLQVLCKDCNLGKGNEY
jgi:hypothetical protein